MGNCFGGSKLIFNGRTFFLNVSKVCISTGYGQATSVSMISEHAKSQIVYQKLI